jgi:2OG-Fe(II) oxygenase superfamily
MAYCSVGPDEVHWLADHGRCARGNGVTTASIFKFPATDPAELRPVFQAASPWPHLVVDDVVDANVAAAAVREAHQIPTHALVVEHTRRIHKLATRDPELLGPNLTTLIASLNEERFVQWVRDIVAEPDLEIDPTHHRAALFLTPPGGWQRLHEDFPKHPVTGLWARFIAIVYLSEWEPGSGGELDQWSRDMRVSRRMEPLRGRMILFGTNSASRHGVLQTGPHGPPRVAVAARYYSRTPPEEKPGSSFWRTFRRPGERPTDTLPAFGDVATYLRSRAIRLRPPPTASVAD